MSSIRSTVTDSLRERGISSSYAQYAEPVITALEEREEKITEGLRQFADRKGLRDREIDSLFVEVGLMEPQPVADEIRRRLAEPVTSGEGDLASVLNRINDTLVGLTEFARQHGYRG